MGTVVLNGVVSSKELVELGAVDDVTSNDETMGAFSLVELAASVVVELSV